MKKIRINNINLELRVYTIKRNSKIDISGDKPFLRYQMAALYDSGKNTLPVGKDLCEIKEFDNGDYDKMILLYKTPSKNPEKIHDLSEYLEILRYAYCAIKEERMLCLEPLIKATCDKSLIDFFKGTYAKNLREDFRKTLQERLQKPNYTPIEISEGDRFCSTHRRYSVMRFVKDLRDKGIEFKVLTGIVEYKRITIKEKDSSENTVEYKDDFVKFSNYTLNKTRANISLQYLADIKVTTKDGKVYDNLKTFKSVCIVKDGELNTRYLAIKSGDKKFLGRLKQLHVIMAEPISGEYIIDLGKIPVASRADICHTEKTKAYRAEYDLLCSTFQLGYVEYLEAKSHSVDVYSPEEIEASKYGIDLKKGLYSPISTKTESTGKSYKVSCITSDPIGGFPKTASERTIIYNNRASLSEDMITAKLIKEVDDFLGSKKTLKELLDFYGTKKREASEKLSEIRFKMIMGKSCKFSDTLSEIAYDNKPTLSGKYGTIKTSWKISNKTITL